MKIIVPFWQESRVQPSNQDIIVPAIHRPGRDDCVVCLLVKIGLGPNVIKNIFRQHIRGWKDFAAVKKSAGCYGFNFGDGEGGLKALLVAQVCWDDVVISMVEFAEVWPPL